MRRRTPSTNTIASPLPNGNKWRVSDGSRFVLFIAIASLNLCVDSVSCSGPRTSETKPVLFVQGKTVAEVVLRNSGDILRCNLIELEEESDAGEIIVNRGLPVKYPSFQSMLKLINRCSELTKPVPSTADVGNDTILAEVPHELDLNRLTSWSLWNGILPGTKWCGMGDIAKSFDDLGRNFDVDSCCRAHDHCPVKLKAFRSGYGIINFSFYTKSHCDCDRELLGCLKGSNNRYSDVVGNFYFNVMRIQCLRDHRPFVCVDNGTDSEGNYNCKKWMPDDNSGKMRAISTPLKY